MRESTTIKRWALLLAGVLCVTAALTGELAAAEPPSLVNYEGVLRDPNGVPRAGDFDMVFRFFDAATLGNEILVEGHVNSGTGAVKVKGGLFNVLLGSGEIEDGSTVLPNDPYTTLSQVFRDFSSVFMEVQVDGEALTPRIRVVAAPFALNSDHLDGMDASAFLDTSSLTQTKSGKLVAGAMQTLSGLKVDGQITIVGGTPGAGRVLTSGATGLATWEDLPAVQVNTLNALSDRLHASDPSDLPFATLRSFDCSGVKTAELIFTVGASSQGTVTGFVGGGRISDTYEYLVAVERNDTSLNTESSIGQDGQLILVRDGAITFFSGMVTEAGLAGWDGATATYVFRLEPHLSIMSRNSGYETFGGQKASAIIPALLGAAGLTAATVDPTAYTYESVIRYEETPLSFLNRLTEGEGIHYHFREGAGEEEVLFLISNAGFTPVAGSFNYHGDLQDPGTGEEFVATIHSRTRQFSGDGLAAGWDYVTKAAVVSTATVPGGSGELQEFFADVDAGALAQPRADAIVAREQVRRFEHSGTGNVAYLKAGHTFTLNDLTTAGFGGSYVVTDIRHYAVSDPAQSCVSYGNAFTAIPSTVDYRPPRRAHPPRVSGPVVAIVTDNEDPDKLGRVKVKYPLDPGGPVESGWARIAHPNNWGKRRVIPRIDDEVLVDFVRGDPMVPIVIGGLHNGTSQDEVPRGGKLYMVEDTELNQPPHYGCLGSDPNTNEICPQFIYFYDDSEPDNESLSWKDDEDRFEFTNDLWVTENLGAGGQLNLGGGAILLDEDGPDASQFLYFFDANSPVGQSFSWNDAVGRFDLTNTLNIAGNVESSGQLKGGSLDVGTGTISGGTLLNMGSGQILGGLLNVGSGPILGGTVLVSGTVQGATVNATSDMNVGTTLTLPGPISMNGSDISMTGGLFTFDGHIATTGDADLAGDLTVNGGDIRGTALNVSGTSQVRLMGGTVSISSSGFDVVSSSGISSMIDSRDISSAMSVGWYHDGSLANVDKLADLNEAGDFSVRGSLTPFVSFDIAESFLAGDSVEAGDLVRLDPAVPGAVRLTEGEGDALVIGVVSGKPGIVLGGGSFDEAALRSTWGDEVGSLFGEDRARLREAVLAEHDDLREALERLDPERGAEDPLRVTPPGVIVEETEKPGPAIDSGTGGGSTVGDVVGRDRGNGGEVLVLDGGLSSASATAVRAAARHAIEDRIEAKSLERFYLERFAPVALAGRVPVKVDASYGAIEPGDHLTPSPVPGVAMKAAGAGPVIGMALEGLGTGRGMVLVFVSRGLTTAPVETETAVINSLDEHGALGELSRIPGAGDPDQPTGALPLAMAPGPVPAAPAVEIGAPFEIRRAAGTDGRPGAGLLRVDAAGDVYARGAFHPASMDLAEYFPLSEQAGVGDLLVVDPGHPGRYGLARKTGDPAVVGIVSGKPGVLLGSGIDRIASADPGLAAELEEARLLGDGDREEAIWSRLRKRFEETHAPVALAGTVLCKVDAAYGAIMPGDLLTTSQTPGHAQRADDPAPGTVIGKALEPLENGTGRIRVLVMTR